MIVPLFSSPLYQSIIPSQIEYKTVCDEISYQRSDGDNGWISDDQDVIQFFPELASLINDHIRIYIKDELKIEQDYYITNSWINKHLAGDYLPPHSHANSIFTGIYYISLPPNSGEFLSLHQSPFIPSFVPGTIIPTVKESNIFNSKQCDIQLEEGTILMFPSHVEHYASKSQSELPRYALSFNIFLKGSFGMKTSYLTL